MAAPAADKLPPTSTRELGAGIGIGVLKIV
jgi:hypothetical protein